ncbi:hypothetical protein FJZ17_04505 [Candidatus Pacearchaeota archaeon]|nr:hypothetical protein [Candidatus Pacearchaeota archaeon]
MNLDRKIEQIMLNALKVNLGHSPGENVVIVTQRWEPSLGEKSRPTIEKSIKLCEHLHSVYKSIGVPTTFLTYIPKEPGSGVNPTRDLYAQFEAYEAKLGIPQIVIAPCAYSITHTAWRKQQCEKGSRIATMSNSSLAMFQVGGPFDFQGDYDKVVRETKETAEKLRSSEYVRVTGPNTDIVINIDRNLVILSTGHLTEPGKYGNWLGAEAFAVPVHLGNSYGYFLVPKGWGGIEQLKYAASFHIEGGRFIDVRPIEDSQKARAWIDENVKPRIFNKPGHDIVAELGIGINPSISDDYLTHNWSLAVAEKKGGTVHVAHGNSKAMGGQNDVEIHQDFVILNVDKIKFNYQP